VYRQRNLITDAVMGDEDAGADADEVGAVPRGVEVAGAAIVDRRRDQA
jgi:hypothetical protein